MLNVALIGTWHVHFEGYAKSVASREDCKITALWDPDSAKGEQYAKQFGCDFVSDYDALLKREDVDAVLVCTATNLHYSVILKAANAKKHIFTEKVLCFKYSQALEIKKAVEENGVKFCISFPWRSRSDYRWAKAAVDSGLVGTVTYCRMRNAHNGASAGWLPDTFYDRESCGGGAMMDLGAHPMYLLNWLMGEPECVKSVFTHCIVESVEDNAVSVLTYKNGAIGVSETAFVAQNDPSTLEITGTKGTIMLGGAEDKAYYNTGNGWETPVLPEGDRDPIDMWVSGILYGTYIPYGIDDAAALTRTMEMAYSE